MRNAFDNNPQLGRIIKVGIPLVLLAVLISPRWGYWVIVKGDSMDPMFQNWDIVIANPFDKELIKAGDPVIAWGHLDKNGDSQPSDFTKVDFSDGSITKLFVSYNPDGTYQLKSANPSGSNAIGTDIQKLKRISWYLDIHGFHNWVTSPWRRHQEKIQQKKYKIAKKKEQVEQTEIDRLKKISKEIPLGDPINKDSRTGKKVIMPLTATIKYPTDSDGISEGIWDIGNLRYLRLFVAEIKKNDTEGVFMLYQSNDHVNWSLIKEINPLISSEPIMLPISRMARYIKIRLVCNPINPEAGIEYYISCRPYIYTAS